MNDNYPMSNRFPGLRARSGMDTSVALNRLSKVAKVRASANELEALGDTEGAASLRRVADRNEAGVFTARPDLKP